jgi:protein ImuB
MYACLYSATPGSGEALLSIGLDFSPAVEQTAETTVVFSIAPLRRWIGSPHQIASEISRAGYERHTEAHLAIAANPDTAILLAHYYAGTTLVTPGEERHKLGPIPLAVLLGHDRPVDEHLLATLHRWGLKTCEDLAALPERGVVERLGTGGVYLRNLARGAVDRPLRLSRALTSYEEHGELEHPLALLEPLLFLLGRALQDLCNRLRTQSRAARSLTAEFRLEEKKEYHCALEFPVPLDDAHTILKLLQLHLERHSPEAAVAAFTIRLEPVAPRRLQGGIFLPVTPPPDKLQVTLARIAGMVGQENVGVPALLNTHRPDAFEITADLPGIAGPERTVEPAAQPEVLPLAIRLFRPALPARVRLAGRTPRAVFASRVKGSVVQSAGPWKTSGEWWTTSFWTHEEWDVALDDGALYRIFQDMKNGDWFVRAMYD